MKLYPGSTWRPTMELEDPETGAALEPEDMEGQVTATCIHADQSTTAITATFANGKWAAAVGCKVAGAIQMIFHIPAPYADVETVEDYVKSLPRPEPASRQSQLTRS